MRQFLKKVFAAVVAVIFSLAVNVYADSAKAIDANVDASLKKFAEIQGSDALIKDAKGVLVFPKVFKAGIGFGGEYGEGALRVNGKTVDYYSTAAASIGFQLGAQKKTIIIVFRNDESLNAFRYSEGWKVGVDASVAVIAVGAGGEIDTRNIKDPVVAFILDQKGLMYNVTLEGAKITKITK